VCDGGCHFHMGGWCACEATDVRGLLCHSMQFREGTEAPGGVQVRWVGATRNVRYGTGRSPRERHGTRRGTERPETDTTDETTQHGNRDGPKRPT